MKQILGHAGQGKATANGQPSTFVHRLGECTPAGCTRATLEPRPQAYHIARAEEAGKKREAARAPSGVPGRDDGNAPGSSWWSHHELDVPGLWAVLWRREGTPVEERRKMAEVMLAHH